MIVNLDHLQLALPKGAEDRMRAFYIGFLGCCEVPKPAALAGRGGFWVTARTLQLHFGIDPNFVPATKAHPAFVVDDLDELAALLVQQGHEVNWDTKMPEVRRFFTSDPVGNRIELIAA